VLTSQLCGHLSGAARHSDGWDILHFRTEVPDETNRGRRIDLAPAPLGIAIWIEARRYTGFDILFPLNASGFRRHQIATEMNENTSSVVHPQLGHSHYWGIQRFKAGLHGGAHVLAL